MDTLIKHTPQWTMSDRMWKARKDAGLTAAEIAEVIGISRKSVTNYETGTTKPLKPILRAWAEVTGTYVEWLEDGVAPFPSRISQGATAVTHQSAPRCHPAARTGQPRHTTQPEWGLAS